MLTENGGQIGSVEMCPPYLRQFKLAGHMTTKGELALSINVFTYI